MQNYNSQPKSASDADQVDINREVKILNTRNFERIQRACFDALTNKKFVGVAGDPGLGKSTALQYFQKNNRNVFVVVVKPSMSTKDFWISVFESIHDQRMQEFNTRLTSSTDSDELYTPDFFDMQDLIKETQLQMANIRNTPNLHFIIKQVSKNLNRTGGLLCIDEGGKFRTTKMLELVHELRDSTMEHAGIIMAGPEYFRQQLQVWVNKRVNGLPELWSRISYWKELQAPGKDEIKIMSQAYGVADPEAIKEFQTCRNFRSLYNRIIAHLEDKAEAALLDNLEIKQTA